ncbi:hypothetical protein [Nostoc sp.]|uniref:hypothetical protein n=1 Tax=Nostoc sp. TaxID=1180 RepID=UPI002FFA3028
MRSPTTRYEGDRILTSVRENSAPVPTLVKESQQPLGVVDFDNSPLERGEIRNLLPSPL